MATKLGKRSLEHEATSNNMPLDPLCLTVSIADSNRCSIPDECLIGLPLTKRGVRLQEEAKSNHIQRDCLMHLWLSDFFVCG
jgi:hypothetical protein